MYRVRLHRQVLKDLRQLKEIGLGAKAKQLQELLARNPYETPPPFKKLNGSLEGKYSRRINIQHRMVYMVDEEKKEVRILRMWTRYE